MPKLATNDLHVHVYAHSVEVVSGQGLEEVYCVFVGFSVSSMTAAWARGIAFWAFGHRSGAFDPCWNCVQCVAAGIRPLVLAVWKETPALPAPIPGRRAPTKK